MEIRTGNNFFRPAGRRVQDLIPLAGHLPVATDQTYKALKKHESFVEEINDLERVIVVQRDEAAPERVTDGPLQWAESLAAATSDKPQVAASCTSGLELELGSCVDGASGDDLFEEFEILEIQTRESDGDESSSACETVRKKKKQPVSASR